MLSTFPSTSLLYFQGKLFMCHQEDFKSPWPTLVSCKPNICKTGRQICVEGISQHIAEGQSPLWDLAHHYVIESSPSWGMSSYGVQKGELWLWVLLTVSEMFLVVMALRVPVGSHSKSSRIQCNVPVNIVISHIKESLRYQHPQTSRAEPLY